MSEEYVLKEATGKLSVLDTKPNYNMTFHRDGKQIGVLDFNGPEMVFSGDMDESAKVFFDWIARSFKARLGQEREAEREACAKVCEDIEEAYQRQERMRHPALRTDAETGSGECADAIRARGVE